MKRFLIFALCMLVSVAGYAQEKSVSGVIKGSDGNALAGITVTVKGTRSGAVSNSKGEYRLAIPEGGTVLVFRSVGYKVQEVTIGDKSTIDVKMAVDAKLLDEIVVTGVSAGTSTKKLGFAIGKVSESTLKEVPGTDAANALRGKVSGVQIVQPSGIPGTAPSIRLRGSSNIQGSSDPLIIIDGIIAAPGTSLADINLNDVQSIEVIKGAAGASFYGSQAANGVVQIITKRGASDEGKTEIKFRNETGFSTLQKFFPLSNAHSWQLNANGSFLFTNNNRVPEADQYFDNPFPGNMNMQQELFTNGFFMNNYLSVASTQRNTNFMVSFDQLRQDGVVKLLPGFQRLNARLNVDHKISEAIKVSTSLLYSQSGGAEQNTTQSGFTNGLERGQSGPFYGILLLEPSDSLYAKNPDGSNYRAYPTPGRNNQSPLYSLQQNQFALNRDRFLGNVSLSWKIADWWRIEAQTSYDRTGISFFSATKKNTYNQNYNYTGGGLGQGNNSLDGLVGTATSFFNQQFGDLKTGLTLKYQYEQYRTTRNLLSGTQFSIDGVPQAQNLDRSTISNLTDQTEIRSENIFANVNLDYKDQFIIDFLVRRDGSSLFGADQRYQIFFRGSASWVISSTVDIPEVQDLKIRASFGTAGQRPLFADQYETFTLNNGVAVKDFLGNRALRPSRVQELEIGVNAAFLNMFTFEFNYAQTAASDQLLVVPLSSSAGFTRQVQNAGTMNTQVFEANLGIKIIDQPGLKWDVNLIGSRVRQVVTNLGRPPFATDGNRGLAIGGGIAGSMFEIRENETFGAMYGNKFARSVSELTVNAQGNVDNLVGVAGLKPEDFMVNSDGYLIRAKQANGMAMEGSIAERPFLLFDKVTGQALRTKIGDSNPDFVLGLANNLGIGNLSIYFNVDAQIGGNVYNATRQLLYFNERHADLDQSGKAADKKKANSYYIGGLYNGNNPVSHFVEEGGFVTIREVNVSYLFDKTFWESIGFTAVEDVRLAIIGRNLFTFSQYSGYNPEVAFANNSTSFRVDQFTYPVFRTFSASLQIRF